MENTKPSYDTFNGENQCPRTSLEPHAFSARIIGKWSHFFLDPPLLIGIQINTLKETDLIFGKFDATHDFTLILCICLNGVVSSGLLI